MSKQDKAALAAGAEAIRRAESRAATVKAIRLHGTLASVVKEITRLHNEVLAAARISLEKAIVIGKLLYRVRASRKGEWMTWLDQEAPFSHDTAMRYMRCYENRDDPKFRNVRNLSDAYALICMSKNSRPKVEAENLSTSPIQPAEIAHSDGDQPNSAPEPQRRHKSQKQIMKELQLISEQQRKDEIGLDGELVTIIKQIGDRVRAQWLEFPDRLSQHSKKLSESAERLKLNTPRQ